MKKLRSDLHSRTKPHTLPLRMSYGVSVVNYTRRRKMTAIYLERTEFGTVTSLGFQCTRPSVCCSRWLLRCEGKTIKIANYFKKLFPCACQLSKWRRLCSYGSPWRWQIDALYNLGFMNTYWSFLSAGCHQMETFSALLAICVGNSPVPGEFPTQRPVTRNFGVFFDLSPNKLLSKQSCGWWFETPSHPLWRHRNVVSENHRG